MLSCVNFLYSLFSSRKIKNSNNETSSMNCYNFTHNNQEKNLSIHEVIFLNKNLEDELKEGIDGSILPSWQN
jgi:hypothetical protein